MLSKYQIAISFWDRFWGVIKKGENFSPLFIPKCKSVHTFWMKKSIDIFWIDKFGKLLEVRRSVSPRKIISNNLAYGVVETSKNKIKNIKIGEKFIKISSNKSSFSSTNEEGSVVTEFALILPVLILLIFGFLEISLVLIDKLKLTHTTNYATFVGATTNNNTKIVGALDSYYDLSDITYTIKSISSSTGNVIADSARRHNDIVQLEIKKSIPISIPLMTITNIDIVTKSSARVVCTSNSAPFICD